MEPVRLDQAASDVETRYESDFYGWTRRQAALLRAGRFGELDVANIVEEIETLGRSEAASLESAYRLVAMHLLKLMVQPDRATRSWTGTITRERLHAARVLRDNPGLKPRRQALYAAAYADARKEAAQETGVALERFPLASPFTLAQVMDEDFWAGPPVG